MSLACLLAWLKSIFFGSRDPHGDPPWEIPDGGSPMGGSPMEDPPRGIPHGAYYEHTDPFKKPKTARKAQRRLCVCVLHVFVLNFEIMNVYSWPEQQKLRP